jgi:hypothetical protein
VSPFRPFLLPQPRVYPQPVDLCAPYSPRRAFVFITIQIPFPVTPLSAHPYKTPGGATSASLRLPLPRFVGSPTATPAFSWGCRLLDSLCPLFRAPFLCFQQLADSFSKTPGVGYPPGISLLESTSSRLFFFDLFATQLSPGRRSLPPRRRPDPVVVPPWPIPCRATKPTPQSRWGRAAYSCTWRKMRHRLKLLKTLPFRAIVFDAVWYRDCLSNSRTEFRERKEL